MIRRKLPLSALAVHLLDHPLRLFALLGSLVPPLLVVANILIEGVNIPFYDQWFVSYPIAIYALDGKLEFAQLANDWWGHRIFFTNLVTLISARFFQWNLFLELFVTVALAVALLLLVVALVYRDFRHLLPFVTIPISVMIFSLRGRHTWMTSFQSCFLFVTLFFLLALWMLQSGKVGWRPLLLAALFALCATFSLASGMIVWALLLVGLPLFGYRKPAYLIFWLIAAAVSIYLYYSGVDTVWMFSASSSDPAKIIHYALIYLGGIFVPRIDGDLGIINLAVLITLLSIVLVLCNFGYLWWVNRSLKRLTIWILIAGYAVGTALVTGFGRIALYPNYAFQALEERYTVMAVFWWISVLVLGAAVVHGVSQPDRSPLRRLLGSANLLTFVVLIPLAVYAICYQVITYHFVSPNLETCAAQLLLTEDDDQATCLLPGGQESLSVPFASLLSDLAQRRLAMFARPELEVELMNLKFEVLQQVDGAPVPQYQTYSLDGVLLPSLFEHASAQVEYALTLPATYAHAEFDASVYLDPANLVNDPGVFQDGVIFSASVTGENGETSQSEGLLFNPHDTGEPLAFSFDLSVYVGQRIRLQLQTESLTSSAYDWSQWLEPMIRLSD
ncbi:MAG: hypothetical protein ABI835_04380 [Chloroflexota bacterium]